MSRDLLAVLMALLAAFFAALGIVIRQRATADVPDEVVSARAVVRNRMWWAGTAAALAGYVCQALALSKGSLLLVQPLLVSALLFALPMSAGLSHRRVRHSDWGWALLLTIALAVFVLVGQPRGGHYRPPVPAWTLVTVVMVPFVAACVAVAARVGGRQRAVLLGVAVGALFGTVAVLTKMSMHRLTEGGLPALLSVPAPYLLVVLAVLAMMLQQSAFRAGVLETSVPAMLVVEPLSVSLLEIAVLGEYFAVSGPAAAVLPLAALAMAAATIALGRGSAAREQNAVEPTGAVPGAERL